MKYPGYILLIIIFIQIVNGCTQDTINIEKSIKDTSNQLYIEVSAIGSNDYFYDHKMGMKIAEDVLSVKTEYIGPPDYDMSAMINAFELAIAKKPSGIVVVGFEPSLSAIIDKAVDAGIPVVTVDADLPDSKRIAFVGTGNFQAGLVGGEKLCSIIGGKGQVALMTKPGQSNLEERIEGYRNAIEKYPDVEIIHIADTQSDPNVAAQAAATLLQKYPNLAGIACVEAAGGSGAAIAVKEAGKAGKVAIVSMDRGNEVLEYIGEGVITASIAQQTALMPFYAVQILYQLNNTHIPISTDNKTARITGVPLIIDTGVIVIDKTNYKFFIR